MISQNPSCCGIITNSEGSGTRVDDIYQTPKDRKQAIAQDKGTNYGVVRLEHIYEPKNQLRRRVIDGREMSRRVFIDRGGRGFEYLTSSNGDEKDERGGKAKLRGDRHFEGNWGLHFLDAHGRREIESGNREIRFRTPGNLRRSLPDMGRDTTCTWVDVEAA